MAVKWLPAIAIKNKSAKGATVYLTLAEVIK